MPRKSLKDKVAERFKQIQADSKHEEDKYTDKDLHPDHPDNR